ncbi:MAG: lipid A export permease/ATP-binding protein MsbA [Thiohalobacterales bacterium]|nr:lipid A export permease/ATP-binding protein MsbA [Thiohalobacterales bacterium]
MDRPQNSRELYFRLLGYTRPYWKAFLLTLLSMVILAMTEPAIPALMKPLLDGSFIDKDPVAIRLMPVLLVLLFLVRGLSSYASTFGLSWVSGKVVHDIRTRLFGRLLDLPPDYFHANPSGTIISKITFNVNQVAHAASNALLVIVKDSLAVIGLLGWMIYINWRLSLIVLVVVPAIGLIMKLVSARMRRLSSGLQQSMGDLTHTLEEAIKGNSIVKLYGGQDYENRRFRTASNRVRRMDLKIIATTAANVPAVQLVAVLALAIIIYIAASERLGAAFDVSTFVSYFGAMGLLFSPIKRLTKVNEALQRGLAASESIFDLLAELPEEDHGTRALTAVRGEIEFRDVSLRYGPGDPPALDGINLLIRPGETIALVGRSGSGKSSLAALVPRFYQPTAGQVLLDGADIRDIRLTDLRQHIGLVSQDIVLFNDSVAANIAYGAMRDASETEIVAAARAAHAMEFIDELPEGLQTEVGEDGARLSGGQRQRLAIARALLKNAPILILDEATSALDTESERHVHSALKKLMEGRTSIIIAHRLSTIENADRIVVMEDGRIVESGTHRELLDRGGAYWRLYDAQSME